VSDRLNELRRQRDLARQQLAWLESEIAAAEGAARAPAPAQGQHAQPAAPVEARSAEAILEDFRQAPASIAKQTKLGCVLYFAGAMLLLILAVAAVYLYARATRGH
jgi:hypothetical protein